MTEKDIKNMVKIAFAKCDHIPNIKIPKDFVIAFAHLVANKEREACAKVAENLRPIGDMQEWQRATAKDCAAAIRARNQQ